MNEKSKETIEARQDNQKTLLLEQLKKTPVIQLACEKMGIARATYYRWRKADEEFAKACDEALREGSSLVNDMAESQLLGAIRDRNMTAIIFWLKHHHHQYRTKVELTGKLEHINKPLTSEQQEFVDEALRLAALNTNPPDSEESNNLHDQPTSNA